MTWTTNLGGSLSLALAACAADQGVHGGGRQLLPVQIATSIALPYTRPGGGAKAARHDARPVAE